LLYRNERIERKEPALLHTRKKNQEHCAWRRCGEGVKADKEVEIRSGVGTPLDIGEIAIKGGAATRIFQREEDAVDLAAGSS
jgi:hypothetical protein